MEYKIFFAPRVDKKNFEIDFILKAKLGLFSKERN